MSLVEAELRILWTITLLAGDKSGRAATSLPGATRPAPAASPEEAKRGSVRAEPEAQNDSRPPAFRAGDEVIVRFRVGPEVEHHRGRVREQSSEHKFVVHFEDGDTETIDIRIDGDKIRRVDEAEGASERQEDICTW